MLLSAPLLHNKYVHKSFPCTHATANYKKYFKEMNDKWNRRFEQKHFGSRAFFPGLLNDPSDQAQVQQMFEAVLLPCH